MFVAPSLDLFNSHILAINRLKASKQLADSLKADSLMISL